MLLILKRGRGLDILYDIKFNYKLNQIITLLIFILQYQFNTNSLNINPILMSNPNFLQFEILIPSSNSHP